MANGRELCPRARVPGPSRRGIRPASRAADRKTSWGSCCITLFACRRRRALDFVFARDQLAAQQLADRRFRNGFDEDVLARPLEIGQAGCTAKLVEFGLLP